MLLPGLGGIKRLEDLPRIQSLRPPEGGFSSENLLPIAGLNLGNGELSYEFLALMVQSQTAEVTAGSLVFFVTAFVGETRREVVRAVCFLNLESHNFEGVGANGLVTVKKLEIETAQVRDYPPVKPHSFEPWLLTTLRRGSMRI